MKAYHKNPRRITGKQVDDLADSLTDLGDLSGIVHDLETDEIIGGNWIKNTKCVIIEG